MPYTNNMDDLASKVPWFSVVGAQMTPLFDNASAYPFMPNEMVGSGRESPSKFRMDIACASSSVTRSPSAALVALRHLCALSDSCGG